jgi:hypothetical protein
MGRLRKRDTLLREEGGGGWEGDGKKAWSCIYHSILSASDSLLLGHKCIRQSKICRCFLQELEKLFMIFPLTHKQNH